MARWLITDLPPAMRRQVEDKMRMVRGKDTQDINESKAAARKAAPEKPAKNKFGAKSLKFVMPNGDVVRFDSKHEYAEYQKLALREKAGEISGLRVHVRFSLFDAGDNCRGEHFGCYTADFTFRENGKLVVADAKSPPTRARRDWKRTKQLLKSCHGHEVIEL